MRVVLRVNNFGVFVLFLRDFAHKHSYVIKETCSEKYDKQHKKGGVVKIKSDIIVVFVVQILDQTIDKESSINSQRVGEQKQPKKAFQLSSFFFLLNEFAVALRNQDYDESLS